MTEKPYDQDIDEWRLLRRAADGDVPLDDAFIAGWAARHTNPPDVSDDLPSALEDGLGVWKHQQEAIRLIAGALLYMPTVHERSDWYEEISHWKKSARQWLDDVRLTE